MSTKQVKEILSWYGSDSPGTLANLARMLNPGRLGGQPWGRCFVRFASGSS